MHAALPLVALVRLGFGGAPTPVRPLADPEAFRALVQGTQASGGECQTKLMKLFRAPAKAFGGRSHHLARRLSLQKELAEDLGER